MMKKERQSFMSKQDRANVNCIYQASSRRIKPEFVALNQKEVGSPIHKKKKKSTVHLKNVNVAFL